jgi:hypothetical protein
MSLKNGAATVMLNTMIERHYNSGLRPFPMVVPISIKMVSIRYCHWSKTLFSTY